MLQGGHVDVDIPNGVVLVFSDFAVAEDAIVQDCEACGLLVANHAGQLWLGRHVEFQADVVDRVSSVGVTNGKDHAGVVVEGEFVFKSVAKRTLEEGHVALGQIEI